MKRERERWREKDGGREMEGERERWREKDRAGGRKIETEKKRAKERVLDAVRVERVLCFRGSHNTISAAPGVCMDRQEAVLTGWGSQRFKKFMRRSRIEA